MKFFDAIRAMGPEQLLISPIGTEHEIDDGRICYHNAKNNRPLQNMGLIDGDGWSVIDKPRPRVRFADAMRAALEGKSIRSCESDLVFIINDGYPCLAVGIYATGFGKLETLGDWEIIEPEGDK